MQNEEAVRLIRPGIMAMSGHWADVGAGTGTFTMALASILSSGKIYALDKSPHALWNLSMPESIELEVVEADFLKPFELPLLHGIIMANALHYAPDPVAVLTKMFSLLRPGGSFILVEYQHEIPNPPWVPYPVSFRLFERFCQKLKVAPPVMHTEIKSIYNNGLLYGAHVLL